MLSALFDRIGELIRVTAGRAGAKGRPPQSAPRPTYAVERVLKRKRVEKHESLVSRMLRRKPAE